MKKLISGVLACVAALAAGTTAAASNKSTYTPVAKLYPTPIEVKLPENNIELAITAYGSQRLDVAMGEINFGGNVYSKPLTIENYSEVPICVREIASVKKIGGAVIQNDPDADVNKDLKKNVKFFLSGSVISAVDTRRDDGVFKADKGDIMITTTANKTPQVLIPKIAEAAGETPSKGYFKINGDAAALPNPYWDEKDGAVITLILKITPAPST